VQAIKRNQELVLKVLSQAKFGDRVMVLYGDPGGRQNDDDLETRLVRHLQFLKSDSPFLEYHFALVHLLGQACLGKIQATEVRVQNMYQPEHMTTVAMAPESSLQQRTAFADLLYHVCLDADTVAKHLHSTLRGSGVLFFYHSELERLAVCPIPLSLDEQKYLLVGVLPCLVGILKLLDTSRINTDTRNAAGKHALELAGKLNGQLSENQVNIFHDYIDYICPSIVGELDLGLMAYDEEGLHTWAPEETAG